MRSPTGTLSAFKVCAPTLPVASSPWRNWKRLTASTTARVVDVAGLLVGRHVVADDETPAQQRDVRPARPRRELGVGRQGRPAAAHLNGGIAEQRFLDALIGALIEDRIGGQRQRRGRPPFRRRRGLGHVRRFGGIGRFGRPALQGLAFGAWLASAGPPVCAARRRSPVDAMASTTMPAWSALGSPPQLGSPPSFKTKFTPAAAAPSALARARPVAAGTGGRHRRGARVTRSTTVSRARRLPMRGP